MATPQPKLDIEAPAVAGPHRHPLEHLAVLQARVLGADAFAAAAAAFVTELAERFGYERVSLGMQCDAALQLAAISHGQPGASLTADRELVAVLEETLLNGAGVCVPRDTPPSGIALAHTGLVRRQGGSACSIPLVHAGRTVGAVCFERRGAAPAAEEIERLEHLLCLLGPVLHLRWLEERPLRSRIALALRAWLAERPATATRWKRYALAAALAALALAAIVPVSYQIGGRARIEGATQRVLAAPMESYLQAVHVRPGDRVEAGQLLAELADRDIRLEQRKWSSQLTQHENAYAQALARADRSQAVVHHARVVEARAQLELIGSRLERVQVLAPFAGTIVSGDLSQSVGAPLQLGAALMTIASADGFRVIVHIDERDIAAVRPDAEGRVSLSAMPWDSLPIRVVRVSPMAAVADGDNVFEVETRLLDAGDEVRPGLQGIARIDSGQRPLLLGLCRRAFEWVRFTLWAAIGWS